MQLFDQQAGNDPSRRFAVGSQNPNFLNMQRDTIVKPIQFTVPENIQNDTHKIQNPRSLRPIFHFLLFGTSAVWEFPLSKYGLSPTYF